MPEDFDAFFAARYRPLVRALWSYCGDRAVAEESAQEAFVAASREWERVRSMASPGGWLHRVGLNAANAHYRRRRIERRALEGQHVQGEMHDPDVADAVAVRRALLGLRPTHRAAVALFYFSDLSVADIADVMDVAEGTVKSWLSRARQELRQHLDPSLATEEVPDGR